MLIILTYNMNDLNNKVKKKCKALIKLLQSQNKYTPDLSIQIGILAQLWVKTDSLGQEILSDEHQSVIAEVSREGNPRYGINPLDSLYLMYIDKLQTAIRASGMNTDSKSTIATEDQLNAFMNAIKDD